MDRVEGPRAWECAREWRLGAGWGCSLDQRCWYPALGAHKDAPTPCPMPPPTGCMLLTCVASRNMSSSGPRTATVLPFHSSSSFRFSNSASVMAGFPACAGQGRVRA